MTVDDLLHAARHDLLSLAPQAIAHGELVALLVTPDLDGGAIVKLWPLKRIVAMLGLTGGDAAAAVFREIWTTDGDGQVRVIVCAPGEPVQVVVMELVNSREARAA